MELSPASSPSPPEPRSSFDVARVGAWSFASFGVLMLLVAAAMVVEGDFGTAVGAGVFGLVFCGVGYLTWRLFRTPLGTRRVLVSEHRGAIQGTYGQTGTRTSRTFRTVDADLSDAEVERLRHQWAEAPWTQRPDWVAGRIPHEGAGTLRLMVGFAIAWNVVANGIACAIFVSAWGTGDVPWFVLLFPLIGLVLVVWTARLWIRKRKFGVSVLHLDAVPAWLGGRLRGTVETGVPYRDAPAEGFRVRLACIERSSYYDRDNDRHVREEALWETETHVHAQRADGAPTVAVPIDLALPADQPSTRLAPSDDRTLWRLSLTASVPGVDHAAQFEVPVFEEAPPDSAPALTPPAPR